MRKQVGTQLCITGVLILLTSFAWAAFDADLALAVRELGVALLVSGVGVRSSATAALRVWLGWLGLLLLVPGLFSLPLLTYLRFGSSFTVSFSWLVYWSLGLLASCGAVLMISATERRVGISERQEKLHADLALLMGRAYQAEADPLRVRSGGAFWIALLIAEAVLAVRWSGLPLAKLPALLIACWFVAEATTVLHELAHTLWGMVLGYDVADIRVGGGPSVARFALGSVPVELGLFPSHGRVHFRFGETPAWQGMRRVAWAGPVSGILPLFLGVLGLFFFERGETLFWISLSALLAGLLSLGQLSPELARVDDRLGYTDGMWLFLNEAVRRQTFVLLELANRCAGLPASDEAHALLPRFIDFWDHLQREANEPQSAQLLAALTPVAAAADSPLGESPLCELFALGMLTQRALKDDDLDRLELAVDAYDAGSAPLLLKTRALAVTARALAVPVTPQASLLAERWSRRAVELAALK